MGFPFCMNEFYAIATNERTSSERTFIQLLLDTNVFVNVSFA